MQAMHKPVRRLVPGATKAVLFVHGLLSTPRFFADFLAATPEDVSVHCMLLPGHGGSVPEFGRVPWGAWREAVGQALEELCAQHERVYIVAHSLGTLLAINSLMDQQRQVAGMLLIAIPLYLHIRLKALVGNVLKGIGLGEDPATLATYYGTDADPRIWRYVTWLPRYVEFFAEMAAARKNLPYLTVPTEVFLARKDELVSMRSATRMKACPDLHLTMLNDSTHHAFVPQEKAQLLMAYQRMLQG